MQGKKEATQPLFHDQPPFFAFLVIGSETHMWSSLRSNRRGPHCLQTGDISIGRDEVVLLSPPITLAIGIEGDVLGITLTTTDSHRCSSIGLVCLNVCLSKYDAISSILFDS